MLPFWRVWRRCHPNGGHLKRIKGGKRVDKKVHDT